MKHVPITNNTKQAKYIGRFRVAPGETRIFDEDELPHHLRNAAPEAAEPEIPQDPLLEVLDGTVDEVAEALPGLSDDELDRIEQTEKDGNTRKGVEKAIAEERLRRAASNGAGGPTGDDNDNNRGDD